jgi:hypothetical protein
VKTGGSDRLRAVNDPLLWPIIDAADDGAQEVAIEEVIAGSVQPLVAKMTARFRRTESGLQAQDLEDLFALVSLRLLQRLRAAALFEEHAIGSLADYVATLSFNALYDLRRQRHPERHRLKKNLRYALTHDARFALWQLPAGVACGLAPWKGRSDLTPSAEVAPTPAMQDSRKPADALAAILKAIGAPLTLDALVNVVGPLWNIRDVEHAPRFDAELADTHDPITAFEQRQYLATLWSEIRELPDNQRAALLFNMRDSTNANAVAFFLFLGIAGAEEIAAAMRMSSAELSEVWNQLPMDDLSIGARLGYTRQQVINLRKTARTRLARRMAKRE